MSTEVKYINPLFLIYFLLLEQALIAMDDKSKSMGRALRGWLERRKSGK